LKLGQQLELGHVSKKEHVMEFNIGHILHVAGRALPAAAASLV
jgi:hypothetical protein